MAGHCFGNLVILSIKLQKKMEQRLLTITVECATIGKSAEAESKKGVDGMFAYSLYRFYTGYTDCLYTA